jgi:hypothetical protein
MRSPACPTHPPTPPTPHTPVLLLQLLQQAHDMRQARAVELQGAVQRGATQQRLVGLAPPQGVVCSGSSSAAGQRLLSSSRALGLSGRAVVNAHAEHDPGNRLLAGSASPVDITSLHEYVST